MPIKGMRAPPIFNADACKQPTVWLKFLIAYAVSLSEAAG
jgi:hypothetical protein